MDELNEKEYVLMGVRIPKELYDLLPDTHGIMSSRFDKELENACTKHEELTRKPQYVKKYMTVKRENRDRAAENNVNLIDILSITAIKILLENDGISVTEEVDDLIYDIVKNNHDYDKIYNAIGNLEIEEG